MEVFPTIARDVNTVVYCSSVNDLGGNPFFPDFDLFMVKLDTGETTPITDTGREREYAPSLSGDGKLLTFMADSFGRNAGDLYMMNLDNPSERVLLQENLSRRAFPHLSYDGKYVIYSAPAGETKKMDIFIVEIESRKVMNISRTPDREEVYPDFSDDRNIIVYELKDGEELEAAQQEPKLPEKAPGTEPEKGVKEEKKTETSSDKTKTDKGSDETGSNDGGTLIAQAEGGKAPEGEKTESGTETKPAGEAKEKAPEGEKKPEEKKEAPAKEVAQPDDDWEIWAMNVKNGQKKKITDNKFQDMFPIISGDGTWVVFTSAREDFNDDSQNEFMVYLMDLLTMKETQISTMPFHHDTIEISW
jgi:Tol biopolymer transport system component